MTRVPRVVPTATASPDSVLQTLAWLRRNSFRPVPLHPRSKAAISQDYTALSYDPPADDLWRSRELGVGVVTGPAHHGPVDVDLDCPEALFFAPLFLPPTDAIFGRASKLRSHRLYRVDIPNFDKQAFIDPVDRTTLLELRGDAGHQTVMPGSTHEGTGEAVCWDAIPFPEVPIVSADALRRAAQKTALACLVARRVWQPGFHNEPTKLLSGIFYYLEWTLDEAEQFIQALMEWADDKDKSRIPTVRATYRRGDAGKKVAGAGVLRKQLRNDAVVDKILELAGSPSINVVQEYNERYAVVSIEGKFRIVDTEVPAGEPPVFYAKDDWLNFVSTDLSDATNDKGVRIPKSRLWLASPRRRQYRGVDFLPGVEVGDEPGGVLNLWTGWAVPPLPSPRTGDQPVTDELPAHQCGAWLELLAYVICGEDRDLYGWMLHWFANVLREPMSKSLTAPVIIGPEGAGKSLLLGYFGRILGPGYVTVTNEEHVYGRFNKHVASCLLLHSEEALYGGEKRHAGIIRSLITDEFRIYEQKGVDARRVRNYLRLVLTSNELHAAPAKPGDRRYTVVMMGERKASDELIRRVLDEMRGDGPAALHRFLLDMDYDPSVPRVNVKNEALTAMKEINLSPLEAWWRETLARGQVLPDYLKWAQDPENDDWPPLVSSKAMYASMQVYFSQTGARQTPNPTLFALQLNRFVGKKLWRAQRSFNDPLIDDVPPPARHLGERQYTVTDMPDLNECRAAFERHLGQQLEWPEEGEPREREKHDEF